MVLTSLRKITKTLLFSTLTLGWCFSLTISANARNFYKDQKFPVEFSNQKRDFTLVFKGQYFRDFRYFFDNESDVDSSFVTRAARLTTILKYKKSSVTFVPEFIDAEGVPEIFDFFFTQELNDDINFRVGKVRLPISMEWNQSISHIAFAERRYPTYLFPARDIGAYFFGKAFDKKLEYFSGIFYGTTDMANNNSDVDDNKDFKTKFIFKPTPKTGLGFGFSYGKREGKATNPNLPFYRSMGQQRIFTYNNNIIANGENIRFVPQAYIFNDNYGIMAEYVIGNSEVLNLTNNSTANLEHTAYAVIVSYSLTGEELDSTGKVIPLKKFSLKNDNYGAFVLNGSVSGTKFDESAFAGFANANNSVEQAETLSVGLKWILNNFLQVKTDYNFTEFQSAFGAQGRETENAVFTRLQVTF